MKGLPKLGSHMRRHWNEAIGYTFPAIALSLLVAAVFLPAVRCGFVDWDDGRYVSNNIDVIAGLSPQTFWRAWTTVTFHNWAPLTTLSYLVDTSLFGTQPWGYHLTNVLIHAATSGLLFVALTRMTGSPWRSLAATLLFALHPLRVESVAWIAERKDVLSLFFLAVTLMAYERYCERPSWNGYAAVAAAMTTSLLAKATLVTLPVLLLLLDGWPLRRIAGLAPAVTCLPPRYSAISLRAALVEKVPLFALSLVFVIVTISTQSDAIKRVGGLSLVVVRLPLGLWSIMRYLGMTVWPVDLHPAYCHPGAAAVAVSTVVGGIVGFLGLAAIVLAAWRSKPAVAVGLAWFVVALSPVLGIVAQQGIQSHADRFTYVPHVGLSVAVVWLVADVVGKSPFVRSIVWTGLVGVLGVFMVADQRQIARWHDSNTLWQWILSVDPGNYIANRKHGERRVEANDYEAGRRHYRAALDRLETVGELDLGEVGQMCALLADVEFVMGNHVLAMDYCERVFVEAERQLRGRLERQQTLLAADDPAILRSKGDLANLLQRRGKIDEADQLCLASLPDMLRVLGEDHEVTLAARQIVAESHSLRGDHAAAETVARDVLTRARNTEGPTSEPAMNATGALFRILDAGGKTADAERIVRRAIDELPVTGTRHREARLVLQELLAVAIEKQERFDEAVALRHRVADDHERLHGRKSFQTAAALTKHAMAVAARATARGDHRQAAAIHAQIHANYQSALGPDHADTRAMAEKQRAAEDRARRATEKPAPVER